MKVISMKRLPTIQTIENSSPPASTLQSFSFKDGRLGGEQRDRVRLSEGDERERQIWGWGGLVQTYHSQNPVT